MIARAEAAERIDAADAKLPIDRTEHEEPMEPAEPKDPIEPMLSVEFADHRLSALFRDPIERNEPPRLRAGCRIRRLRRRECSMPRI